MSDVRTDRRSPAIATGRRFAFPTEKTFLSQAVLLEEAGPPRAPALVCLLGFAFVAIAVLAAALIEIDVVTSSTGQIVATDGNQILQTFDGGIVDRVEAEQGQIVEDGDVLLTLKDPEAEAQLDRLTLREAALFAQVRRFQSLLALPSTARIQQSTAARAASDEQLVLLDIERDALLAENSFVQAEVDRRSKALENVRALEKEASERLILIEDQLSSHRQLYDKGLLSKTELLDIQQQTIDAISELKEVQGQIREAEAAHAESKRRLLNVIASRRQSQGDQLSSVLIDLHEIRQQIKATHQRLDRREIKAMSRGVVMELKVQHQGQSVPPGDPIAEIIPIDGGMQAQARLSPSEISHVHPGQAVRIAIDGIEPHRHGYLEGIVELISPSTFIDENALPYYRALIGLASDHLDGMPLTPGMTVQAQIKTDRRTILEYLLKPVYRAWSTAFRER